MLILAGVVLNLTLGERGIFNIAKNASKNFMEAQDKELSDLEKLYSSLMVATGDDSTITVKLDDLKKIIQDEVNISTQALTSNIQLLTNEINTLKTTSTTFNSDVLYDYDSAASNNKADATGTFSFSFPEGKTLTDYKYLYFFADTFTTDSTYYGWENTTSSMVDAVVEDKLARHYVGVSWAGNDVYGIVFSINDNSHFRIDLMRVSYSKARIYKVIGIK